MKKTTAILFCMVWACFVQGQNKHRDTLHRIIHSTTEDTSRLDALWQLSDDYLSDNPDSAWFFAQKGHRLAKQSRNPDWEAQFLFTLGKMYKQKGNYPVAVEHYLKAKNLWDELENKGGEANAELFIGEVYAYQDNCALSLDYYRKAQEIYAAIGNDYGVATALLKTGICYDKMKQPDSALYYLHRISSLTRNRETIDSYLGGMILHTRGNIYDQLGDADKALVQYRQSIPYLQYNADSRTISQVMLSMANLFKKQNQPDSSLSYARQSFQLAQEDGFLLEVMSASEFLARYYKDRNRIDSAFAFLQISLAAKDSLFSRDKIMSVQNKLFADELLKQEMIAQQQQLKTNTKIMALLAVLVVSIILAMILWRNNKHRQKAYALLQKQKQEIQNTLAELKAVQQQLIHAEKMASLGEVTAGIAHEIQNPLNFITNFSDLSTELVGETREAMQAGNTEEANNLLDSLDQSVKKISLHGNRADAIVKNMLQHSRKHTGERVLSDINTIIDEYLQLSYQTLRSKDNQFSAILETHFDNNIGKVSMIPQDIGRVLLNLFNNAFYSIREKARQAPNGYQPMIQVSTRKINDEVEIRVWDNGTGIPEKVVDKIYQPFFTTKPTGEGTGLGLSMSFDIVTKMHGGKMKVNTKDGEFAEFIIEMPIQ